MIEFRALKQEELEQWFDHCMYVFNEGKYNEDYRQYFKNHINNDPWRDIDSILVAVEEGKILSTVRIFHRKIFLNGCPIEMGGIGEVSTKSEYAGMGLATKLLSLAIKRMEEINIKASMLGTSEDKTSYYNRLGWITLPRYFKITSIKADESVDLKFRPINFEEDIIEVRKIYSLYSEKLNGIIVRDNDHYWSKWIKNDLKNCYVVENDEGKLIAYIDFEHYGKTIRVREFGEISPGNSLFNSILAKIVDMLKLDECEVKYGASIESMAEIDGLKIEKGEMIRLIKPFKLGDLMVESTEQLINLMTICEDERKTFIFWDADGF